MDLERLEKIDKLKTKMLKYIFYKRRTEKEIIEKFKDEESDIFEEAVETLKELGYIDDSDYVSRYIHDVMILKNISIFEIKYKLYNKGIDGDIIENTITNNLVWTIENFKNTEKGKLTFPTKFSYVDDLLPLNHKRKIIQVKENKIKNIFVFLLIINISSLLHNFLSSIWSKSIYKYLHILIIIRLIFY